MSFNFKETESAKGMNFMTPGVYALKPTKVELGKFPKGTSFLAVTFTSEDDQEYTEKFVLSEKALPRLQYLHEGFFGKKCEKNFSSEKEVETYFRKALTGKEFIRNIIVGGEISKGNVYAVLPYTNFIVEEGDLELGEFEEGDENWKKYVKKRTNNVDSSDNQENGLLNDDDDADDATPIGGGKKKEETPAKNNKAKTPAANGKNKTPKAEDTDETAKEDDDLPW
jgi:hypothetical protein